MGFSKKGCGEVGRILRRKAAAAHGEEGGVDFSVFEEESGEDGTCKSN